MGQLPQKKRKLTVYGLNKGLIFPYSDEIIKKFRKIYYGGIPASIILLNVCNEWY